MPNKRRSNKASCGEHSSGDRHSSEEPTTTTTNGNRDEQTRKQPSQALNGSSDRRPHLVDDKDTSVDTQTNSVVAAAKQRSDNSATITNGGAEDESPLKVFGEAKGRINDIYQQFGACIAEAAAYYSRNYVDSDISKCVNVAHFEHLKKSIETIQAVLSRNQMKVAFFGRTSNGKSTTINAILHDKVLPTGFGHTTNCFLQIEGTNESVGFTEVSSVSEDGKRETRMYPIESVATIANALNSHALEHSALVRIVWPVEKCHLLKYDVVLVDSPGVDVEENLDKWIDEHCHDADVFVLVSNAESTLNIAEKNFFHKVSEKLSKPSLFVLNNRWDAIDDEPECMEVVRKQHIDRSVQFLSKELKIVDEAEARQRTFFVSAKEILQTRMASNKDSPTVQPSKVNGDSYKKRLQEFVDFERKFEECLSKSAVKTKFKKHTDKGLDTVRLLTATLTRANDLIDQKIDCTQGDLFDLTTRESKLIENYMKLKDMGYFEENISIMRDQIKELSKCVIDSEVSKLASIVKEFTEDFIPTRESITSYKQGLFVHVEEILKDRVQVKFHKFVGDVINPFFDEMSTVASLLPDEHEREIKSILEKEELMTYHDHLNLHEFCKTYWDFQENLEFQFSLGIFRLIRKFKEKFIHPSNQTLDSQNNLSISDTTLNESNLEIATNNSANSDFLAVVERFVLISPQSPTTVGTLAAGGILIRTVGWRIIASGISIYGTLYIYEYLTWTNAAKKKAFKRQFVAHAKTRLRKAISIISDSVASSAEQKLKSCLKGVDRTADREMFCLKSEIERMKASISNLVECRNFTEIFLSKSDLLMTELVSFANTFFY